MTKLKFTVLVVDDDPDILELVSETFEREGYLILRADNAAKALEICAKEKIDVIVSDIRMPEVSGIQLFELLKEKNIPFIVMTGDPATDLDLKKAHQRGIRAYFEKPFDEQHMLATLALVLYEKLEGEDKDKLVFESEYYKIPVQNLTDYSNVNEGVYLKVSANQYLKIATHPTKISSDKIAALNSKKIDCLYITKKDYAQSVSWGEKESNFYAPNVRVSLEQKMALFGHLTEKYLDVIELEGADEKSLSSAKSAVESVLRFLVQTNDFYHVLSLLHNSAPDVLGHSIVVSVISVMMMKKIGWNKPTVLFKIAMAGFVHDIGCIDDKTLRGEFNSNIPISSVNNITHSQKGATLLSEFSFVPEEVKQAVIYHHENLLGTGPFKVAGVKLQPLIRLINTANAFAYLYSQLPWGSAYSLEKTFQQLTIEQKGEFDLVMVKALMELFNTQVPIELEKIKIEKYAS